MDRKNHVYECHGRDNFMHIRLNEKKDCEKMCAYLEIKRRKR